MNLTSHLYLTKIFLPLIEKEENDKSIVLISSINALKGYGAPAYSSSKAGLYGFVKSMTSELGETGIRINAVSPGTVPTPRTLAQHDIFEEFKKTMPLHDFASVDDVADVVFSITNITKKVTGQNIVIDAGQIVSTKTGK